MSLAIILPSPSLIHELTSLVCYFSRSLGATSLPIGSTTDNIDPDLPPFEARPWEVWAQDCTTYWIVLLFYSKMGELVINSWIRFNQSLPEYHIWRVREITTLRSKSQHLLLYLKTFVSRPRQHQQVGLTWFEAHHIWILRTVDKEKKQNLRNWLLIYTGNEMISSSILNN